MIIRTRIILAVLLLSAASLCPAPVRAQSGDPAEKGVIIVESADYSRQDIRNKIKILKGNIFIKYIEEGREGEIHIRGQEITVDEKANTATAKGGVTVIDGDVEISGETLFYKFKEKYFEMTSVSGSTEAGEQQGSRMYFEGARATGTERKIKVFHSRFSTCGPHCPGEYHMTASNISIFPAKKVIARKVGVYLRNTRVIYLPVYIASLKDDDNYRPEFGYNKDDGFFMKNRYPYITEDPTNDGKIDSKAWLILNYIEKRGNDYGTENRYYSGKAGGPGYFLFVTNNQKGTGNTNQRLQMSQDFTEGKKLKGGIKYNRTNTYNRNLVGYRTNINNIDLDTNYTQNKDKNVIASYKLSANKGNSESENATLNIARRTRLNRKTTIDYTFNKTHSKAGILPKNEEGSFRSSTNYSTKAYRVNIITFKNFDMDGDSFPHDRNISVNNTLLPQATFTLSPSLWNKKLPLLSSLQLIHGRHRSGTRNKSSALRRNELKAVASKNFRFGKLSLTPNQTYTQRMYSTRDAMYVMEHTTQALYDVNKNTKLSASYNKSGDSGGAPFPGDKRNEQVTLNGNLSITKRSQDPITGRSKNTTMYRMSTNYNYRNLKYSPLSISYTRNISQNATFQLTGSRDLNYHRWSDAATKFDMRRKNTAMQFTPIWNTRDFDLKTMDFKTTHTRRNGWKIDVLGRYQHRNPRATEHNIIKQVIATKTRCCTEMQFYYNIEKKEFKFQYYILAFPSKKFGFTQGEQGFELDDSFTEFKSESQGVEQ